MNRNQAKALIMSELEEQNIFYSQNELNSAIQDAYDEVSLVAYINESRKTYSLQANTGYINMRAFDSRFYRVLAVFNEQTKRWLDPVDSDALDAMRLDWELMTGSPRWMFMTSPDYLCIAPRPASSVGTLTIFYNLIAPTLTDTLSFVVPLETQDVLIKGPVRDMLEQAREFKKAAISDSDYQKLLKETAIKTSRRASPDKVYRLCPSGLTVR